jgi:hypothetical protein
VNEEQHLKLDSSIMNKQSIEEEQAEPAICPSLLHHMGIARKEKQNLHLFLLETKAGTPSLCNLQQEQTRQKQT